MDLSASLPPPFAAVRAALPPERPVYLVGGAVRDLLLGRPWHDLDFVLAPPAIPLARRVANRLGAAFYPLDTARDAGRVLLTPPDGPAITLDFTALRAPTLEADLRARDFTLNAIALDVQDPTTLIDPLGGAADLQAKRLRACGPTSMQEDPVRIWRGVRQALTFGLQLESETRHQLRAAAPGLAQVSPERLRDELFRLLESGRATVGLRALDRLDALAPVLPEVTALCGVTQSPPHIAAAFEHTLAVLDRLEALLDTLQAGENPPQAANWLQGTIALSLGRFREPLARHLETALSPQRSLRGLLALAALYHDTGKAYTRTEAPDGRVRFFEHEAHSAALAEQRAHDLRLSSDETARLKLIVAQHMRPHLLAYGEGEVTRRAIYRFFHATGAAGVDVCLLSLADLLATYGPTLPEARWQRQLAVVRSLLSAYWESHAEMVAPAPLLSGHTLMETFALPPGPQIGRLLQAIQEAQAVGAVTTRAQALALAAAQLASPPPAADESAAI